MKKQIIFILIFGFYLIPVKGQQRTEGQITYTPVGVFHTDYTPETGAPRQGILKPEAKARIEIFPEYRESLRSLEIFEYIIVIYHFDKINKWTPTVRPRSSNPDYTFGLFATRSPNRPNPVGIATIKLEKIEDGILYVSGTDAFDGTPVLDIKPYLPSIDIVKSTRNEYAEKQLGLNQNNSAY